MTCALDMLCVKSYAGASKLSEAVILSAAGWRAISAASTESKDPYLHTKAVIFMARLRGDPKARPQMYLSHQSVRRAFTSANHLLAT